jgi:hypothetical protein
VKRVAAALLVSALSLSCVVYSQSRLRGELPVVLDPELAGKWLALKEKGKPEADPEGVEFLSHGDHYAVVDAKNGEVYEMTTARLGGVRYLNMVEVGGQSLARVAIWRYEIHDGVLEMGVMDYDEAKRLVKAGTLAGIDLDEVDAERDPEQRDQKDDGLLLTASSAELEEYLLEHGSFGLFPELEAVLVREAATPAH